MFNIILLAALLAPADPIIDRTRPLLSDFDISGMTVSVEVTRGPGYFEYLYRFAASSRNRGTAQDFLLHTACDAPVPDSEIMALFPGRSGQEFTTNVHNLPYMPVLGMWTNGESGIATVYPAGMAHFWVMLEPGGTDTVRIRSTGAPVPRLWALEPNVEYHERIDWPPGSDMIEGLPGKRDFRVTGVIEGPGCESVASTQPEFRLQGVGVMDEFPGINSLLTYSMPLRNRLHLAHGEDAIEMLVHYGRDLDPATFETCPATLRRHFNPAPGVVEKVRLPVADARSFVTLAARAKGPLPVQPRHDYATRSPVDVDVFEFRRNDIDYVPREIDCRPYTTLPPELVVLAPPPPPEYDNRPLFRMVHAPSGPVTVFAGQRHQVVFILSELADPASLRVEMDGENVTSMVERDGHGSQFFALPLPAKLGERHVVMTVRALPEVVNAPAEPERVERRIRFQGMQVQIQATGVRTGPDGKREEFDAITITTEIDPETGKPVEDKREQE